MFIYGRGMGNFLNESKIVTLRYCHSTKNTYLCAVETKNALVVELVDTPDLGSGAARRVGSSPIRRTDITGIRGET